MAIQIPTCANVGDFRASEAANSFSVLCLYEATREASEAFGPGRSACGARRCGARRLACGAITYRGLQCLAIGLRCSARGVSAFPASNSQGIIPSVRFEAQSRCSRRNTVKKPTSYHKENISLPEFDIAPF